MGEHSIQANKLKTLLKLSLPPVAVGMVDTVPSDIEMFDGAVPAGCRFWQEATTRTFATSTSDHELCSIGVHTHNLSGCAPTQPAELRYALQAMSGLDYVRPEEVASIPVMEKPTKHVLYGPLVEFPVNPDVVLLFAHATQGLVLSEAVERVDSGAPPAMGRPACAVIPKVINTNRAAMSLGCCGARAYLDVMTDSVAMWAFPAGKLDKYCEALGILTRANDTLAMFHAMRRSDVELGKRPTVQESLRRLA